MLKLPKKLNLPLFLTLPAQPTRNKLQTKRHLRNILLQSRHRASSIPDPKLGKPF